MRNYFLKYIYFFCLLLSSINVKSQNKNNRNPLRFPSQGLTYYTAKDSSSYIRFIGLLQFWVRNTEMNPGTLYKNEPVNNYTDFTIRRLALINVFQIHPRLLFLTNISSTSNSSNIAQQTNLSLGFADAYGEYKFSDKLFIGAGLHQWTGFSRLNLEGVGTMVNLDIPKFQFPFINQLDRNNRMLGIYAKGRLGKLDYRISLNDPFVPVLPSGAANSGSGSPSGGLVGKPSGNAQVNVAYYNPAARSKMVLSYLKWQFLETEYNKIPYETGNYLGQKRIFNIGAGLAYRKDGMLNPEVIELQDPSLPVSNTNPLIVKSANKQDVFCYAIDAFLAYRFTKKQDGINIYTGYYHTGMGNNYYNVSATNQTVTVGSSASPINGPGGSMPSSGTGHTFYVLAGYLAPVGFINANNRFGVFGTYQNSKFEALKDPVQVYEAGINWLVSGNGLKITAQYRNRPVYKGLAAFGKTESTATVDNRKSEMLLQMQISF